MAVWIVACFLAPVQGIILYSISIQFQCIELTIETKFNTILKYRNDTSLRVHVPIRLQERISEIEDTMLTCWISSSPYLPQGGTGNKSSLLRETALRVIGRLQTIKNRLCRFCLICLSYRRKVGKVPHQNLFSISLVENGTNPIES